MKILICLLLLLLLLDYGQASCLIILLLARLFDDRFHKTSMVFVDLCPIRILGPFQLDLPSIFQFCFLAAAGGSSKFLDDVSEAVGEENDHVDRHVEAHRANEEQVVLEVIAALQKQIGLAEKEEKVAQHERRHLVKHLDSVEERLIERLPLDKVDQLQRCGQEQDQDLHENVLTCVNSHQSEADAADDEEGMVEGARFSVRPQPVIEGAVPILEPVVFPLHEVPREKHNCKRKEESGGQAQHHGHHRVEAGEGRVKVQTAVHVVVFDLQDEAEADIKVGLDNVANKDVTAQGLSDFLRSVLDFAGFTGARPEQAENKQGYNHAQDESKEKRAHIDNEVVRLKADLPGLIDQVPIVTIVVRDFNDSTVEAVIVLPVDNVADRDHLELSDFKQLYHGRVGVGGQGDLDDGQMRSKLHIVYHAPDL